jgi:uncharacterized OsmC-like protein
MTDQLQPTLRDRQSTLKQGYRDDPATAIQTSVAYSVTDQAEDPTRIRIAIDGPTDAVLEIAAHPAVGGLHDLPCSGDILMASLAGCFELTTRLVAAALGMPLHRLDVRVEGEWDARGTLGVDREAPVGYTAIRVIVDIETEGPQDRVDRLVKSAERYCVVSTTLKHPPVLEINASTSTA